MSIKFVFTVSNRKKKCQSQISNSGIWHPALYSANLKLTSIYYAKPFREDNRKTTIEKYSLNKYQKTSNVDISKANY